MRGAAGFAPPIGFCLGFRSGTSRSLTVGFFGSRYERATPAEREYMRAMAVIGDEPVPTSAVADELSRKPSSLSPARDGLIKKGLIYSSERGLIAFTVPHFGRFLRAQPA